MKKRLAVPFATMAIAAAIWILVGCASPGKAPSSRIAPARAAVPVIAYLKPRQGMVVIRSSENGPRFTILDSEENILEDNLSLEELQVKQPGIFDLYRSSIAGSADTYHSSTLDASSPVTLDASSW